MVIPPDDLAIDQDEYRAIVNLRERIERRDVSLESLGEDDFDAGETRAFVTELKGDCSSPTYPVDTRQSSTRRSHTWRQPTGMQPPSGWLRRTRASANDEIRNSATDITRSRVTCTTTPSRRPGQTSGRPGGTELIRIYP